MIAGERYEYRERIIDGKFSSSSILVAKLRFGYETAPKHKLDLRKRMNVCGDLLSRYLFNNEGLTQLGGSKKKFTKIDDPKRNLEISYPICRLGINIKVTAEGRRDRERMLNIESLDDFILTGKVRKEESIKQVLPLQQISN